MKRAVIRITGIVQGVGFRPFVYNLASAFGISGYCLNDSGGVVIEVAGERLGEFADAIKNGPPPLARIDSFHIEDATDATPLDPGFKIHESVFVDGTEVFVSPDTATCADCLGEMFDPKDRRHLYPFINCTNCGPRYTIVKGVPYDRPRTTMAEFEMCAACRGEYDDPGDRRFHAQPVACPECGPGVWLIESGAGAERDNAPRGREAIMAAREALKQGRIVAVKGLGGFHLAADATNTNATARLRELKRSSVSGRGGSRKPFAIMVPDIEAARGLARMDPTEEALLTGSIRPIVILRKAADNGLSDMVAPGSSTIGVMLPYTPLHHLLLKDDSGAPAFAALVMTSGNVADEPIVTSNEEAVARLSPLADLLLLHDRDIYMRADDSIARVERGRARVMRRARGFVPEPVDFGADENAPEVLAVGAHLKNTFCLTRGAHAIIGPHIGDLDNMESEKFFTETFDNIKETFHSAPAVIARDMHPDYMSTNLSARLAERLSIPDDNMIAVQHHHAHIVSCMAEHGLTGPVVGVAFDGTGYGWDGTVWGGEFLIATRGGFTRAAHLAHRALPGGERAIKEPWRSAVAHLYAALGEELSVKAVSRHMARLDPGAVETVVKMIQTGLNTPMTSSAGRVFDAISSLVGITDEITYEGEAAIMLEEAAAAYGPGSAGAYPYEIVNGEPFAVDTAPMVRAIVDELERGTETGEIAYYFHETLAEIIVDVAVRVANNAGVTEVVLSGGVFQNRLLTEMAVDKLVAAGLKPHTHERVPANDGGISLGQAVVANELFKRKG